MLKSIKRLMYVVLCAASCFAETVDIYDFKMSLKIPRVYNNNYSLGYRRLQSQQFAGTAEVVYKDGERPVINIVDLVNKT